MSDTVTQSPAEPDAATIAHVQAQLTALRAAGMLSRKDADCWSKRRLAAANREIAEVRRRLEEIEEDAARVRELQ